MKTKFLHQSISKANILVLLLFCLKLGSISYGETRIRSLIDGTLRFLYLNDVQNNLFDFNDAHAGHVTLVILKKDSPYQSTQEEITLAEFIADNMAPEVHAFEKMMVGPMSAHSSERYVVETATEMFFVTPWWEDHWKVYNSLEEPLVEVQRCVKIAEIKLGGVEYDVIEVNGRYQMVTPPKELTDSVNWFQYHSSFIDEQAGTFLDEKPMNTKVNSFRWPSVTVMVGIGGFLLGLLIGTYIKKLRNEPEIFGGTSSRTEPRVRGPVD